MVSPYDGWPSLHYDCFGTIIMSRSFELLIGCARSLPLTHCCISDWCRSPYNVQLYRSTNE